MAHFDYPPGTPTGTVPPLYVLPSTDWAYAIAQLFKAVNGDDGGTWAPGAFITIGGAGVQFTGTAHELAGSARLTLQSLAEIRIEDGAAIRANGSGSADIFLQVVSNVAKLTVNSGAVAQVLSGGALDMFGALTLKSTAGMTADSGSLITLSSGSTLTQASGGTINVNGTANLNNGGTLSCKSGSTIGGLSGSFAQWAGTWWFAGATTFVGGTWPLLDPARSWERRSLDLALVTYLSGSAPADVDAWVEVSNISTGPCLRTVNRTASGSSCIIEFKNLPPGSTLTSITITTNGTSTTLPTYPTYQIVRWKGGNLSTLSSLVTDEHATTLDWGTNDQPTTITPTLTHTVDASYRYGLKVIMPYAALGSSMRIYECVAAGTSTSLQV